MAELVSVIITTYKGSETLKRAIKSVLRQTYPYLEIIVIDDNDPETSERQKTREIVSQIEDKRIIYIENEKHVNGARARNIGIQNAVGKYIAFLDDDDIYIRERIEICIEALQENKGKCDAVYTNVVVVKNGIITNAVRACATKDMQKKILLNKNILGTGSNLFLTRKAVCCLAGFDEEFARYQDVEFMLRFFERFNICTVQKYLVIKVNNGWKSIRDLDMIIDAKERLHSKFQMIIRKFDDLEGKSFRRSEIDEVYQTGFMLDGNWKDTKKVCEQYAEHLGVKVSFMTLIKVIVKRYFYRLILLKNRMFHFRFLFVNREIRSYMKDCNSSDRSAL